MQYPFVDEGLGILFVIFSESPKISVSLRDASGENEARGRVWVGAKGYLTPAEALAFASNVTLAANLAEVWEKGEETRETVLEKYGKAEGKG